MFQDKRYDFSFKYVKKGKEVYAWDYEGAVIDVTGYNEYTGIVSLSMDHVWHSFYMNYFVPVKLWPVVEMDPFENLWSKHYFWNDDGEKVEGSVKLAMDIQVSPDRMWLLYRSNRNCLTTANGERGTGL